MIIILMICVLVGVALGKRVYQTIETEIDNGEDFLRKRKIR